MLRIDTQKHFLGNTDAGKIFLKEIFFQRKFTIGQSKTLPLYLIITDIGKIFNRKKRKTEKNKIFKTS